MVTRRSFMVTTIALSALSLLPVSQARACSEAKTCGMVLMEASISSPDRPLPVALRGETHLALTGNRLSDLQKIEVLLAQNEGIRVSLDPADWVIFELALSRSGRSYRLIPAVASSQAGLTDVSLSPLAIGA